MEMKKNQNIAQQFGQNKMETVFLRGEGASGLHVVNVESPLTRFR